MARQAALTVPAVWEYTRAGCSPPLCSAEAAVTITPSSALSTPRVRMRAMFSSSRPSGSQLWPPQPVREKHSAARVIAANARLTPDSSCFWCGARPDAA